MILELFQIFRARRDTTLASKLALRFAQGQLLERATAPLLIVHLCLWLVAIIMGAIATVLIMTAIKVHGAIIIVAVIPLTAGLISIWISLRLKMGLDRIRTIADGYSDSQIDRFFDRKGVDGHDLKPAISSVATNITPETPANTIIARPETPPSDLPKPLLNDPDELY
ncbi:hypothetical protein GCM10009069_13410 [Algimonas arctica]|uniref:Uncharacterized protein n=1 Tax=Algimonas arctica TaxID=1479486 RepID=A0A8J3CRV2_9PROT|nr:hypothetical protein [Algimonas arctica]GHA91550.1 hypothetical protein GCM10009069_13410 [Algimonas arctica]